MKINNELEFDNLIKSSLTESIQTNLSSSFTTNVMFQINSIKTNSSIIYKPLISKFGWLTIFCLLIIMIFLSEINQTETSSWFNLVNFESMNSKIFSNFSFPKISEIAYYSILFFIVMLLIQLKLLNNYFNRKF